MLVGQVKVRRSSPAVRLRIPPGGFNRSRREPQLRQTCTSPAGQVKVRRTSPAAGPRIRPSRVQEAPWRATPTTNLHFAHRPSENSSYFPGGPPADPPWRLQQVTSRATLATDVHFVRGPSESSSYFPGCPNGIHLLTGSSYFHRWGSCGLTSRGFNESNVGSHLRQIYACPPANEKMPAAKLGMGQREGRGPGRRTRATRALLRRRPGCACPGIRLSARKPRPASRTR